MSTRNENDLKKVDDNQYLDSGFHSEFQDSGEILLSEEVESTDKDIDMARGNSHRNDKEVNSTDSGIISSCEIPTESQNLFEVSPFVPECLKESYKPKPANPAIDKYFEQDVDGFTKLHVAILHNIEPAINALITLVSDSSYLNLRNYCGQTALHLAVLLNQESTVRKLIDAGADINIRDYRCNTPLHLACMNDITSCIQTIISAVSSHKEQKLLANLEQWNYDGETCFFIASKSSNLPVMKALESVGANVNVREGRAGYTALHNAVERRDTDVIKFLCEECSSLSIDTENYGGLTAFQLSLLTEQESLADYIVEKGATPYYTAEDSDMDYDDSDDSCDYSEDDMEQNQIISKIAEISVI